MDWTCYQGQPKIILYNIFRDSTRRPEEGFVDDIESNLKKCGKDTVNFNLNMTYYNANFQ